MGETDGFENRLVNSGADQLMSLIEWVLLGLLISMFLALGLYVWLAIDTAKRAKELFVEKKLDR